MSVAITIAALVGIFVAPMIAIWWGGGQEAQVSAGAIAIVTVALLILGVPVGLLIVGDERRKRREWRPAGYSAESGPDWWTRPLRPVAVRQSMVLAGEPSPVVLVEERDPRIVTGNGRREWKKPTGHQRKAAAS